MYVPFICQLQSLYKEHLSKGQGGMLLIRGRRTAVVHYLTPGQTQYSDNETTRLPSWLCWTLHDSLLLLILFCSNPLHVKYKLSLTIKEFLVYFVLKWLFCHGVSFLETVYFQDKTSLNHVRSNVQETNIAYTYFE